MEFAFSEEQLLLQKTVTVRSEIKKMTSDGLKETLRERDKPFAKK